MKKHNQDVSTTPWDVRLDDDEDEEDAYFFGDPALNQIELLMGSRKTTRHNPRAIHKNFGKHVLSSTIILSVKKKNRSLQVLRGHQLKLHLKGWHQHKLI